MKTWRIVSYIYLTNDEQSVYKREETRRIKKKDETGKADKEVNQKLETERAIYG